MGNNCVGGGGTPHLVTVTVSNETALTLQLDPLYSCKSINPECDGSHKGFGAKHGKFVEGSLPTTIRPSQDIEFKISGRESSSVCPSVQLIYVATKPEGSLRVDVTIEASGWSSLQNNVSIIPTLSGTLADTVEIDYSAAWISRITLRPKKPRVFHAKLASRLGDFKAEVGQDDVKAAVQDAMGHVDVIMDRRIQHAIIQADGALDARIQQLDASMDAQVDRIGTILSEERRLWAQILLKWTMLVFILILAVRVVWDSLVFSLLLFGGLATFWKYL
eukprot:NODE_4650_length_1034_cov_123.219539_g4447_i0.p1 GENE.NODE_4650_length_1034_cov_123.219539_g4447_i0~~NODE_4650_length_1034_cov_123.219539_g4447_i0.p1  ORF type:complete len:276 (-),score=34.77 NODE_4650_length_1034_cov_123.219539_g4447_i0:110-937(-)